jgi:hypothetical protein
MPLQFAYSEIYHYNFITPSFMPFYTPSIYIGPLSDMYTYMNAYGVKSPPTPLVIARWASRWACGLGRVPRRRPPRHGQAEKTPSAVTSSFPAAAHLEARVIGGSDAVGACVCAGGDPV